MAAISSAADLSKEIEALRQMTVGELRRRHVELFGEQTRAGNRPYLFRRIAWRPRALAEGDLTDRARRRAHELARDVDPADRGAPRTDSPGSPPAASFGSDDSQPGQLDVVGA